MTEFGEVAGGLLGLAVGVAVVDRLIGRRYARRPIYYRRPKRKARR